MGTESRKRLFVETLRRLMEKRHLTGREVAFKAKIKDVKRFYRWAAKGISRANTDEHQGDLERLRVFFGLSSVGEFWLEQSETSLAERLRRAGEISWEYEYAYKVLVILTKLGDFGSVELRRALDLRLNEEVGAETPESILRPKTAEQLLAYLQINRPDVFDALLRWTGDGDRQTIVEVIKKLLTIHKNNVDRVLRQLQEKTILRLSILDSDGNENAP